MISMKVLDILKSISTDDDIDAVKKYLLDIIYPVGSVYENTNNVNPSTVLGGTWEERYITLASIINNGFCVDVYGGTMANSTNIQLYQVNGSGAQKFVPYLSIGGSVDIDKNRQFIKIYVRTA